MTDTTPATKFEETLVTRAVESLGEDAGLGEITDWVETHKEEARSEMFRVCLEAIAGLTVDEDTNHEHLIVLAKTMADITLRRAA